MPFGAETTSMIEIFSGLFISGIGVIHDLLRTYADLNTWTEQDIKFDGARVNCGMRAHECSSAHTNGVFLLDCSMSPGGAPCISTKPLKLR